MTTYMIWSNEHRAWWRPGRRGYTTLTVSAGRYSAAEADAILKGCKLQYLGAAERGEMPRATGREDR